MSAIDTMPSESLGYTRPSGSLFGRIFTAMWTQHRTRSELRRTRLHLFELSDAELQDIGLTRDIADREAGRSLLACYLNNYR